MSNDFIKAGSAVTLTITLGGGFDTYNKIKSRL